MTHDPNNAPDIFERALAVPPETVTKISASIAEAIGEKWDDVSLKLRKEIELKIVAIALDVAGDIDGEVAMRTDPVDYGYPNDPYTA